MFASPRPSSHLGQQRIEGPFFSYCLPNTLPSPEPPSRHQIFDNSLDHNMEPSNTNQEQDNQSTTNSNEYDILATPETPALKPIRDVIEGISFMEGELRDIRKNVTIIKHMDPDLLNEHRAMEKEVKDLLSPETKRTLIEYIQEQNDKIEHAKTQLKGIEWCQYEAWRISVAVVPPMNWEKLSSSQEPLPAANFLGLYASHAKAMRVVFRDPSITLENTFRFFRSQDPMVHLIFPLIQAVATIHAHLRDVDRNVHNGHLQSAAKASWAMKPVARKFDTFVERYEAAYDAHEAHVKELKEASKNTMKEKKATMKDKKATMKAKKTTEEDKDKQGKQQSERRCTRSTKNSMDIDK